MLWSERIWMGLPTSIKRKVEFMECLGLCCGLFKDPQPSLRSICLHTCLVTWQYSLSAAVGSTAWFWEYRSWHGTASIQVEVKFIFQTCWIAGAKKAIHSIAGGHLKVVHNNHNQHYQHYHHYNDYHSYHKYHFDHNSLAIQLHHNQHFGGQLEYVEGDVCRLCRCDGSLQACA